MSCEQRLAEAKTKYNELLAYYNRAKALAENRERELKALSATRQQTQDQYRAGIVQLTTALQNETEAKNTEIRRRQQIEQEQKRYAQEISVWAQTQDDRYEQLKNQLTEAERKNASLTQQLKEATSRATAQAQENARILNTRVNTQEDFKDLQQQLRATQDELLKSRQQAFNAYNKYQTANLPCAKCSDLEEKNIALSTANQDITQLLNNAVERASIAERKVTELQQASQTSRVALTEAESCRQASIQWSAQARQMQDEKTRLVGENARLQLELDRLRARDSKYSPVPPSTSPSPAVGSNCEQQLTACQQRIDQKNIDLQAYLQQISTLDGDLRVAREQLQSLNPG